MKVACPLVGSPPRVPYYGFESGASDGLWFWSIPWIHPCTFSLCPKLVYDSPLFSAARSTIINNAAKTPGGKISKRQIFHHHRVDEVPCGLSHRVAIMIERTKPFCL